MQKQITQKRYSLDEALKSVPVKDFQTVKKDVMKILGIKSRQQLLLYQSGKSMPTLDKAKALEEYFLKNWNITEVWKEV